MSPRRPLVALFRAADDARASEAALAARGFDAALAPVTEIVTLSPPRPLGPFDFLIATSAHALAAPPAPGDPPLWTVGARTAEAARRAGFRVEAVADDVAALIPRLPKGRALYLAGRDRKPDLERALVGRLAVLETYAAQARAGWSAPEAEGVAQAWAAIHYSPRAAALAAEFAARAGVGGAFARLAHVGLSREVAGPLAAAGAARVLWPQRPTQEALLDALESALAERL